MSESYLEHIKIYGEQNNIPNISRENANFLRKIIQKNKYKKILEIGTASGYSTLNFAQEIGKYSGHITTIEFSQGAYELAQDHIGDSSLSEYITQYFGDARDIIPLLNQTFDFIFIDGLKKASLDFFKITWPALEKGGIIIIDDVIKFRYKMESLYEYLEVENIKYTIKQIDVDDGIMMIEKREL